MKLSTCLALTALTTLALPPAIADAQLTVTLTSSPNGGVYSPTNVLAVWVEDSGGTFVKTLGSYAGVRKQHLVAWTQKSNQNETDAVTGATRANHGNTVTFPRACDNEK